MKRTAVKFKLLRRDHKNALEQFENILSYFTIIYRLKHPRCCNNEPKYLITYDCGPEENQTILVCEDHYSEEPFNRFVIKIEKV